MDRILKILSSVLPEGRVLVWLVGVVGVASVVAVTVAAIFLAKTSDSELVEASRTIFRALEQSEFLKVVAAIFGAIVITGVASAFKEVIVGLQRESRDYARKISRRDNGISVSAKIGPLSLVTRTGNKRLRETIKDLEEELAQLKEAPAPIDTSSPDKLFQVARQRLLDEAVRIDAISRRNLILGILFSIIALGVWRGR